MEPSFDTLLADSRDFVEKGKYAVALAILANLEQEQPHESNVQYLKAEALRHTGHGQEAKIINDRLLEREQNQMHFWRQRAWLTTQSEGISATVAAAIKLIEENGPQDVIDAYTRIIARFDALYRPFSQNYWRGRIFLLGGRLKEARAFFAAAEEQDYAAFDIAVIDFLTDGKPIDIQNYVKGVHSPHQLTIWANAMEARGRRSEALALLNSPEFALGAEPKGTPVNKPFLVCTMPKSGTGFYFGALGRLADTSIAPVTQTVGSDLFIIGAWLDEALAARLLPITLHYAPSHGNEQEILNRSLPVFLSMRDPREATWSWFRHMEERMPLERLALAYLPVDYGNQSYDERLVLMYQRYFPYLMQWLRNWKSFMETHVDHPVLFSRYEDFAKDNVQTIRYLLSFGGISVPDERIEAVVTQMKAFGASSGAYHFRKGRAGSWREAINDDIKTVIDAHWDEEVLHYFGYQK